MNGTVVPLSRQLGDLGDCGLQTPADPEWKYSVGPMSRVSQGPSITSSGIHIVHPSFRDLQSLSCVTGGGRRQISK